MGRTVGLAGRGAAGDHVFAVGAVVVVPLVGEPGAFGDLGTRRGFGQGLLGADLLAELEGVGRAVFDALAAGYALVLVDGRLVVGGVGVVGLVEAGDAGGEAGARAAVADGGGLALAVDRGHLVHQTVFFGHADDVEGFFAGDFAAAAGADVVFGGGAHKDAHVLLDVAAALAQDAARGAAGTVGHGEDVVLVEVVGDLFEGYLLHVGVDGALDRDDAHRTVARRQVGRQLGDADAGVFLEGPADLGVFGQLFAVADHLLEDAGGEGLDEEAVDAVAVVDAADADHGQLIEQAAGIFERAAAARGDLFGGAFLAQAEGQGHIGLVVTDDAGDAVVFRRVLVDLEDHAGQAADHSGQFNDFFSGCHRISP
ncbi:MAG: hypothetical protein BWY87_00737 [Deltaproteobacteria bacterium ADurb.Bin510]|nr:MAG: hypothetical protein BWY87_00737 [Deltaproteobacteria bacterium ADurb.Bin510]